MRTYRAIYNAATGAFRIQILEPSQKKTKRPSKEDYYLGIAEAVSRRSTCMRLQYGAVIVKDGKIISTGYNGAPVGEKNCCDIGACKRTEMGVEHGEKYELCRSVHAEANAIISAARDEMLGATLYLVGMENGKRMQKAEPCAMCARLIKNAGIKEVVG